MHTHLPVNLACRLSELELTAVLSVLKKTCKNGISHGIDVSIILSGLIGVINMGVHYLKLILKFRLPSHHIFGYQRISCILMYKG